MLTQQQMQHLYEYLEKPFFGNKVGFEEGISKDTLNEILYIKNNANNFNNQEWSVWYDKNKDNYAVVFSALTTYTVPDNIVHKIVNNLDMFNPVKKPAYNITSQDRILLRYIVANKINQSDLEKIYSEIGMNFISAVSLDTALSKNSSYINHISNETMKFFTLKTLEDFSKHKTYHISSSRLSALQRIKDESFLRKIFTKDKIDIPFSFDDKTAEIIKTELINNKFLSDDFKNELFNSGCNWMRLQYFTPEMTKEIYESCVETYSEAYDKTRHQIKFNMEKQYNTVQEIIGKLIREKLLPEPLQYDLALRIISKESKKMDFYAESLYERTTSARVLETATKLKSKSKEIAYKNPNMPKQIIQDRIETLCDKMKKFIEKDKREKIPNIWDEHISNGLYNTSIQDEYYDFLIKEQGFDTHMAIVLSDYTPKHIKDNIYKYLSTTYDAEKLPRDYQPRVKASMDMMNFCDEKNINNNVKEKFKDYFKVIGPFTTAHSFYEESGVSHYHMYRANGILVDIVDNLNRDELNQIINFCKNQAGDNLKKNKQDTVLDKERNIFKYLYLSLSDKLKYKENIEEYESTKDPSVFNNLNTLQSYMYNIKREFNDKNCCEYYMTIYEKGQEYYNLLIELEKREKEKEREEEIEK